MEVNWKRIVIIGVSAAVAIAVVAGLYILVLTQPTAPPEQVGVTLPQLTLQQSTIREESAVHRSEVQLPEVVGFEDVEVAKEVNEALQGQLLALMDDFKDRAIAQHPRGSAEPYTLQVAVDVVQFTDRYLSLLATISEYTGGAHPMSGVMTVNYDFFTKEQHGIDDVLQGGYDRMVRDAMREQLLTHLGLADAGSDDEGVRWVDRYLYGKDRPSAFERFALDGESLILYVNPYEAAPYAAGVLEIRIPYAELQEFAKPGSVVKEHG